MNIFERNNPQYTYKTRRSKGDEPFLTENRSSGERREEERRKKSGNYIDYIGAERRAVEERRGESRRGIDKIIAERNQSPCVKKSVENQGERK